MRSFIYNGLPARVIFGAGALARLPEELDRLGAGGRSSFRLPSRRSRQRSWPRPSAPAAPGPTARRRCTFRWRSPKTRAAPLAKLGADCCVTVGGGSTTGLGKAIALTSALPILAVPTTYAGSEMTPIYGITEGGAKKTGRDVRVLPKAVIYDPTLTLSLPAGALRRERHERRGPRGGGALLPREQSHRLAHGGGRHTR